MNNERPILIPYGFAEWDSRKITLSNSGGQKPEIICNSSHVLLDRKLSTALRLNNHQYNLRGQVSIDSITETDAQIDYLREHLNLFCGVWEKSQKRFLDCYFDFIIQHVEGNKEDLEKKLTKFGKLYHYRHWLFSALLPLPQAHINISTTWDETSYTDDSMQLVDFCFWTGEKIIAIVLTDDGNTSYNQQQRYQTLRDAEVVVLELAKKSLRKADTNILEKFLPTPFQYFWDTEKVPSGAVKLSTFAQPPWISNH